MARLACTGLGTFGLPFEASFTSIQSQNDQQASQKRDPCSTSPIISVRLRDFQRIGKRHPILYTAANCQLHKQRASSEQKSEFEETSSRHEQTTSLRKVRLKYSELDARWQSMLQCSRTKGRAWIAGRWKTVWAERGIGRVEC
jgi:hypothetical protein